MFDILVITKFMYDTNLNVETFEEFILIRERCDFSFFFFRFSRKKFMLNKLACVDDSRLRKVQGSIK